MRKIVYTLSTLGLLTAGLYATSAQASVINTFWDFTGTAPASNVNGNQFHSFVNDTITVMPMNVGASAKTAILYSYQNSAYYSGNMVNAQLNNIDLTTPSFTPSSLGVGTTTGTGLEPVVLRNKINIFNAGTTTRAGQTDDGHNLSVIFPSPNAPFDETVDIFKQDFIFLDLGNINQFVNVNYFPASYSLEITLSGVDQSNLVIIDGVNTTTLPNLVNSPTDQILSSNTIDITNYIGSQYLYITTVSRTGIQLVSMRFSFEECGIYKNCNGGGDGDGDGDSVPEPGAIALLGFSLAGLALLRRKQ